MSYRDLKWTYSYQDETGTLVESGEVFENDPLPPPGEEKPEGWQSASDKASAAAEAFDAATNGEQYCCPHPIMPPA